MNKNTTNLRIWIAAAMLGLAILACGPTPTVATPTASVQPTPGSNPTAAVASRSDLIMATVQIYGVHIQNGDIIPFYVGSGSIISSDGLILTNAHVADPAAVGETGMTPDALVIGIVNSEDQSPVYAYRAEVRAIDGYADLAVIQITANLKGESVDTTSLSLPYVALGNSDQVHISDHINILGFPVIGGNTITYTDGSVAGFTAEDKLGDRAWIKTSATISGGNSGGMATNDKGQLIGVPSIAASGANTEATDCRVIQDTNGDGNIDSQDNCIPIGGFINGLRPINLALPLIQAARSGQAYVSPYSQGSGPTPPPTGNEQIGTIGWFTVDSQGNLGDQVDSYPSRSIVLVALFNFSGFTNGEPWGDRWSVAGQEVTSGTYTWDQGSEGTYGTSLSNQGDPVADGTYHLELFAGQGNDPLAQADVVVGNGSNPGPGPSTQDGIQLSGTVTDKNTGNPISGAYVIVLNSGVTAEDWSAAGFPDSDILTYAQSDSNGRYLLPAKLARNTPYTVVCLAEGYQGTAGDNLVWGDNEPANFNMDISLSK